MTRTKILASELLFYIKDEWDGTWLTTRALRLRLEKRGILLSWQTLALRLNSLENTGDMESIKTSNGICWKPLEDNFTI